MALKMSTKIVHQGVHQGRQVGTQSGTQGRQDTVQDGTQNVHQDVHQGVHQGNDNNIEKIITLMIEKDNKVTLTKMAKEVGVNEKTIRRCLKRMKNIKFVGSGYSGHWEIING